VEALLSEVSGIGKAVTPLAMRLARETEGNPFYLSEIVKALFEKEMIRLEDGAWQGDFSALSERDLPLPASLTATVEARVRDLEDKAQDALRLAAVLGREFDLEVLSEAWGRGTEAALEALEVLLRHRLVEEITSPVARDYTFTHHKIQEVIYAGMPQRHREYAHARAGKAMEVVYGREAQKWAAELAFHFEKGRQHEHILGRKAIAYWLQAGDQSRAMYAHGDAVDYYQRALALLKERGDERQVARTLMKLGLAYHTALDFVWARDAYDKAFASWQKVGRTERPAPSSPQILRLAQAEPTGLDPALAYDTLTTPVLEQLLSGLVQCTPELDIVPDVARTWQVLDGGRRYVFHLRDDARWSDRTPVTAEDFCYAWQRVLDPELGSPGARLLYDVKGARGFNQGQVSDPDFVAVRAPDATTLVVELEEPAGHFLQVLACSPAYPVPRHVVQLHGAAWTDEANLVTNGPFRLEGWDKGELLVLSHNSNWHGVPKGNVSRVELSLSGEPSAQLQRYEADELHILDMQFFGPGELDVARAGHTEEYVTFPQPFTSYVGFATSQPPFSDPRVRRAFVLATDREMLAEVVMRGFVSPALGGFVPPGVPGHSREIGLGCDPAVARRLLTQAGYPGGRGFPVVDFLTHTDPASAVAAPILESQWQESLGVTVSVQAVEWAEYLDRINRQRLHLFLWAWVADYPDPGNFLRVCPFRDQTQWGNETYNNLVERASQATDQHDRLSLYKRADRMLIDEAVVLPLVYYRSHLLVKPAVTRMPLSPTAYWFWKDVVIESH
jgi:oligopeptide transport system substrate-binding protein